LLKLAKVLFKRCRHPIYRGLNELVAEVKQNVPEIIKKRSVSLHKPEGKVLTVGKKKRGGKTNVTSVSLDPELADEAKRTARSLGLSLSGLIRQLLRAQIMTDADLTIRRERKGHHSSSKD
jgi:tRNA(Ser,Leu) C12 N-acetylase TAN1